MTTVRARTKRDRHRGPVREEIALLVRRGFGALIAATVLATAAFDPAALAAAPEAMSYQGVLTNQDGKVVEDGLYSLRFQIFGTATTGSAIWTQTLNVQVDDGLYNVLLSQPGLSTALSGSPRYLEVRINSGPGISSAVTLSPRQQLSSVPYALRAVEADKTTAGPWIPLQLQNGWVPFGQGWPGPAYFKDGAGIVHLRGLIQGGNPNKHALILILPAGARPEERQMLVVFTADTVERSGAVDVVPNGNIVGRSVGATWLSLDSIQFRAAE